MKFISTYDFSAANIGNSSKIETYIINAGITNETYKTALRTFYSGLVSSGVRATLSELHLMFNGTALADRLNILNPVDTDAAYRLTFVNDLAGAHTLQGFLPDSSTLRNAKSNYPFTQVATPLVNLHLHVFNNTEDVTPGSLEKYIAGYNSNTGTSKIFTALARANSSGQTKGKISHFTGGTSAQTGASYNGPTKTGLLSVVRNGTSVKLYDKGVELVSVTESTGVLVDGTERLFLGSIDAGSLTGFSTAKLLAFAVGNVTMTPAQVLSFSNLLNAFKTAIGA